MNTEREAVHALVEEYADIFAFSVNEVFTVEGAVHRLNIPVDTKFSKKVHQRPLTPPQWQYLHVKIDEMLEAGVIWQCKPSKVKCVSPTTLEKKAHQGSGLPLVELQHWINDQCISNGLTPHFPMPPRVNPTPDDEASSNEPKWRICQNFAEINKITQVAPMPQGDIRAKQQKLSGHRWVSLFDFAAGFYAVTVDEEARPYTAFYVEGRGYFWYQKMPFRLTGAPSTFVHMTAVSLHNLLVVEVMELFVDDGGTAVDEFGEMMEKLRRIFERVREKKLSLSASKSELFIMRAVFAGASIGPEGVQPDQSKLMAIINWKPPEDAQNLVAFLGLKSWFHNLIQGYAMVEKPLCDLLHAVEPPKSYMKSIYRRVMAGHKLKERWKEVHTKAFLELKKVLTSEPVLHRPHFDGHHFIVTNDGSQDAFGAVLLQRFTTALPNGKSVTKLHPLAFASKRTSKSEAKYKPFLLEFAALKFGLDKFSDVIWGFPVEIETDCQALRDVMMNDKLNATHSRWRDGILSQQIVEVRHVPGKTNVVADGLSRAAEGTPNEEGDGSEWTVAEDWETVTGLVHDIFHMDTVCKVELLLLCFASEPMFLEVIKSLKE